MPIVVERPTAQWREQVADEKAGLASGVLDPDDAFAIELWPELVIQETDAVWTASILRLPIWWSTASRRRRKPRSSG